MLQQKLNPGLCAINPTSHCNTAKWATCCPRGDVVFKAYVDQWLHLAKATGEFDRIYAAHVQ